MKRLKDKKFFENIKDFLDYYLLKIRAMSINTVTSYRITLLLFIEYLCKSQCIDLYAITTEMITSENIIRFLDWLEETRHNSIATRNNRLSCMKTFSQYLIENMDPSLASRLQTVADIRRKKDSQNKPHIFLSKEQIRLIFNTPDPKTLVGLRDRTILIILYDTGCREAELLDMKLGSFSFSGKQSSVRITGKGKKTRNVPISESATKALKNYISKFHLDEAKDGFLFYVERKGNRHRMSADNIARIMIKYERIVRKTQPDLPHLHAHLWRHSRAQGLYDAGVPLEIISSWLGHAQLQTTLIYASIGVEQKRKAIEKATKGKSFLVQKEIPKFLDNEMLIKRLYGLY